jgi:hypothetical protein
MIGAHKREEVKPTAETQKIAVIARDRVIAVIGN